MAAPSTSDRGRAALVVLVAGYGLIQSIGSTGSSPMRPPLPGGVGPPTWSATIARWIGLERLSAGWIVAVTMATLGVLVAAFVVVVAEAIGRRLGFRAVTVAAALALGVSVGGPLVLSRDVSSYAAYGRITAVAHANPYVETPADHPDDPFAPVVSPEWSHSRSVYGPAFTTLSGAVTLVTKASPGATILAFKVMAGAAVAGAAWLAMATARRRDPALAPLVVALVGVNPVIVVHTVGGGHNDALVCLGLAGAAFVTSRSRRDPDPTPWIDGRSLLVTGILTVTSLVKIVAVVPLGMFVLAEVLRPVRARARVRVAAAHVAVTAAVAAVLFPPYGRQGVEAIGDLASRAGWASAARLVQRGAEGLGAGSAPTLRVAIAVIFVAAFLVVVRRVLRRDVLDSRDAPAAGWAIALLGAALAGPYLLPWYSAWFAGLIGMVRDRAVLWIGVAACCVLALTGVPAEPDAHPAMYRDALLAVHYGAAPVVLALLAALVAWSLGWPRRSLRWPRLAAGRRRTVAAA